MAEVPPANEACRKTQHSGWYSHAICDSDFASWHTRSAQFEGAVIIPRAPPGSSPLCSQPSTLLPHGVPV
ncbi:Hypp9680 [Branchiostoma lanceolatum]|uniref:Hypp9680 protein n=1 Tax=Branchiostoma lanceolatum TaxID=7740 RepID=A0A8S4MPY3_BRALA|nr:Hypp9680 [Branchiostoma lanceolatum]